MYSVSNAFSKAINADSRSVLYRVTLAGAIVADQTRIPKMVINESVGGTAGVAIGTANSSTLTLTLRKADTINYSNMLVEPESGLVLPDGSIEWLPLGKFWVTDFQTSNDYETVSLSCADGMYHLTDEYVSELTYPTDIKNVVNEVCAKAGVVFVSSLPKLELRRKPEGMTYREVVGYLAGCCGKNARFNRLGQLEFFWYEDSGVTIERKNQYLDGMTKLNDKPLEVSFEVVAQKELYAVTCVTDDNGGMTATPGHNVAEGETVVVSINPFYGYELADISAVTDAGDAVTLFMDSEGGRTFVQPDSNVTVTASFRASDVGPFQLTLRTDGNGSIRANKTEFAEGEVATVYVAPYEGYELDRLTTIPAGISLEHIGTASSGETMYDFVFPKSDVTVIVSYKEIAVEHTISARVDDSVYEYPGYLYVENTFTGEFPLRNAAAGTIVSVTCSPLEGYEFDYFDSSVLLTQVGTSTYNFTMPDEDVEIVAHYKLSEDKTKTGMYSWLALPQYNTPPSNKPYWAVFYKEDWSVPTCKKFYLVWFDSWYATGYNTEYGKRIYEVTFDGYYYCGSQDTGHLPHAWDTSVWSGNGASGSTLEWDVYVGGHAWSVDSSGDYCLLASNAHLFYGSSLIFEKCENAIQFPRTGYVVDDTDVREKGSLTRWKCPDTFSTPLPASNWMIVNAAGSLCMRPVEGKDYYFSSDYCDGLYIVFFDDIAIENIGKVFDNDEEEFYVATVTNGHYAAMKYESSSTSWGVVDVDEGDVIGLRSPLHGCNGVSELLGKYYFSGVLATNVDLWSMGDLFMYKNDCRICDCATTTEIEPIRKFSLRNTKAAADTDSVTISYENPLVYEKMADTVSSLVQGITYTPAKVKHRGNPAFQVGDIIRTPDKNGVYHTVIIMQQTMNFGGGMNSEITSPGQSEKNRNFSANGPLTSQIKKEVKTSNLELERRISADSAAAYASFYKTIGNSESKIRSLVEWQGAASATIASLEQTASDHDASIDMFAKWRDEADSAIADVTISANENNAQIKSLVSWQSDANDAIANITGTVADDSSKIDLLSRYSGYDDVIKVDTLTNIKKWNKDKTYYVTELDTYYTWGTRGILHVVANNNTLSILTDEIEVSTNGNTLVLTHSENVQLDAVDGAISITTLSDETVDGWGEYIGESIARIAMKTNQNSASIGLLVENGSVKGSIIVEALNNDTSTISITSNRLTIDSDYFSLSKDGKITATGGKIADFTITEDRLYSIRYNDVYGTSGTLSGLYSGYTNGTVSKYTNKKSLVTPTTVGGDDYYSSVRFFAGAPFDNTNGTAFRNSKFVVLEDGSMYASAAEISNSGSNGTIAMTDGYIKSYQDFYSYQCDRIVSSVVDTFRSTRNSDYRAFSVGLGTWKDTAYVGWESGVYINFSKDNAQLGGTWLGTSSEAIPSDERKKNTICAISEPYDVLFDNLNPVTYKYNDGTSGRLHTGYTTQGVASAIEKAGLTTNDFAGYMIATTTNSETGEEEISGYLRYDEFIALNTWQIQKLKKEIERLKVIVYGTESN